jgi:hypothetical protein
MREEGIELIIGDESFTKRKLVISQPERERLRKVVAILQSAKADIPQSWLQTKQIVEVAV